MNPSCNAARRGRRPSRYGSCSPVGGARSIGRNPEWEKDGPLSLLIEDRVQFELHSVDGGRLSIRQDPEVAAACKTT